MAKTCTHEGSNNPRFSGGLCQWHKVYEVKPKKPGKPLKRTPIKKKYKVTGEGVLFKAMAASEPNVSFISGERIKEIGPGNCAHVLSKGGYPGFRLYTKNIVFLTYDEHRQWDAGRHEIKDDPRWKKMYDLELELKQEYYNERVIPKF